MNVITHSSAPAPIEGAARAGPVGSGHRGSTGAACVSAAVLAITFAAMLVLSWGKWPDVLVDFGHELYVPWQLSRGKVLTRDIHWYATGPLSPYWNALLFRVFGCSLRVLVSFNLFLVAATTGILWVLMRALGGMFAATVSCLVFVTVFAFGQYGEIGNFNYVTPYSHGATHGMFLSLVALFCLWRHSESRRGGYAAASALCLGLVFLTKPEFFVALGGAEAVALAVVHRPTGRTRALLTALVASALLPIALAFVGLALGAGAAVAWRVILAPWIAMTTPLTDSPFYRIGLGIDDVRRNLAIAVTCLACYGFIFCVASLMDLRARSRRMRWVLASAVAVALVSAGATLVPIDAIYYEARPLPVVAGMGLATYAILAVRVETPSRPRCVLGVAFATFALLLLAKMALGARVHHYGFVLAMPSVVVITAWIVSNVPAWLARHGGSGTVFRAAALTVLALMVVAHVRTSARFYAQKTHRVGSGPDSFLADERGVHFAAAIEQLSRTARPGDTLATIPEGITINYLVRRESPSPYLKYMPDILLVADEDAVLASYVRSPPRFVVLVERDTTEYGATLFGRDYGRDALKWILERYDTVGRWGGSPLELGAHGLMLFELRGASPSRSAMLGAGAAAGGG